MGNGPESHLGQGDAVDGDECPAGGPVIAEVEVSPGDVDQVGGPVFGGEPRQQPGHEVPDPAPWFRPGKA
ncbi:hypothetical protein [Micromonospora echinospora]|uniref:hypothetical protein n=1 Tax=Micromonospora echinospora TaxID=1877 RepID=UPI0012FDE793|nr:hypothetical protein [Micromonospora echinospora]